MKKERDFPQVRAAVGRLKLRPVVDEVKEAKEPDVADHLREVIQAIDVLRRLQMHALGKEEMSATELRAAKILLNKVLPDSKGQGGGDALAGHILSHEEALAALDVQGE